MTNRKIRVADYIAEYIEKEIGVKHVCLLSGGGMMYLTDGLAKRKNLEKICFHHEQAAAMALEAYAKTNNHFSVGYFTTGPGVTHALSGTAGAWLDSVPCLFISGQAKIKEATYHLKIPGMRQCGVQELNIIPIVKSITKYAVFVDKAEDIKFHLQKAYYIAKTGRPGPVWLDVPLDIQGSIINPDKLKEFKIPTPESENISSDQVNQLATYFRRAKRPVILAGYGVRISGAIDALKQFINNFNIPVITTFLGIDLIESDHLQYVGRIGTKGTRAGNLAIQNSDLLIIIGSSLPVTEIGFDRKSFAREAKKVVIDIDDRPFKKGLISIDLLIKVDAKFALIQLNKLLNKEKLNSFSDWLNICLSWRQKYPVCLPEYKRRKKEINLYYFFNQLSDCLRKGDAIVTDAGSTFYAGSQSVNIKPGVRYVTSGGFATMGYGLPASIGVCLALNRQRVMCVTGDGSFQQNIQELQTVVHYHLPLKIFIINNNGYLSIRFTQQKFFNRLIGEGPTSGVSFPDAKKIAFTYGIKFIRITNNRELNSNLATILNYSKAIICEVMTPRNQLIIPIVSSKKRSNGTMVSKPLEDMFPFLPRKEFLANMYIKPLSSSL